MHTEPQTPKTLREFGLLLGGMFIVLFGLLLPWLFSYAWPYWPWLIAILLWGPALLSPMVLSPVYHGWMRLADVLAWVNTHVTLAILFYLVITPLALLMRLFGKAPIQLVPDNTSSHRQPSKRRSPKHMERPF